MIYRKAIVSRTNPAHIAKLGVEAFDGVFSLNGMTSDQQIISYFANKMSEEGYKATDYRIDLSTVEIDPATGKAHVIDFVL
jgi:hypothetical protein